ncbi:MAG: phage tail protein [Elusimicrobia bacterium]|nr:phage tail protein [Elusimicrobiota bacterium]
MMIAVYDGSIWQLLTAPQPAPGNDGELLLNKSGSICSDAGCKFNPATGALTVVQVDGNASTATSAVNGYNPGDFKIIAQSTAPAGFLKCNGAAISRTTYSALFAVIGTTFGVGDGSTTFNLPDLRGEVIRGYDDGRGVDSSRTLGSAQGDAFQGHTHSTQVTNSPNPYDSRFSGGSTTGTLTDRTLDGAPQAYSSYGTPRVAAETRPRNVALLFCVKY